MKILGEMVIGRHCVEGRAGEIHAYAAKSGEQLEPPFGCGDDADVDAACTLADSAFDNYREMPDEQRADFLEAIGREIMDLGDILLDRVELESGLPRPRLEGERSRTVNQLRLFATHLRKGLWHGAVLDAALPDRQPPRPDLRKRRIGLGPVAVFGASNFPLAFSVAGGDTASALAAGCPVVVKSHPAHLGTSELVARAIQKAAEATDMPDGVFSLVVGNGVEIGRQLVSHPAIQAVGFTGSRRGGLALVHVAQNRQQPIPVYAEMSSINPVFLLPGALAARSASIAAGFVNSLVLGAGQFCTNPGIVIGLAGSSLEAFVTAANEAIALKTASTMLTPVIHDTYCKGLDRLQQMDSVHEIATGLAPSGPNDAQAALFRTEAAAFLAEPGLDDENFGPSALLIVCQDSSEMLKIAERVSGQLTATLHLTEEDYPLARELMPILERKAGRILFNDFPTGVEVSDAMIHGGPYPATSDNRSTSVGSAAIERFLRPVCYQNIPDELLPPALRNSNPLGIWRLQDGDLVKN